MSLLEAIKSASPERIVEAFKAAIHAAHTNNPSHGHAAALAVLEVAEPESAPVDPLVPEAAEDADDVAEKHDA